MCNKGGCIEDMAKCCDNWIDASLWSCLDGRVDATGKDPIDVTPNFIIADWIVEHGNIIGNVREMNEWILEENGLQ